jgi:dimethylamine--corrinoid protein Co-methyltransferase
MQGIKTAGDLVLRVQFAKKLRIDDAKKYVADKLGVTVADLFDCFAMKEIREKLGLGTHEPMPANPMGMSAKFNISKILDIPIPSVELFKKQIGMGV